MSRCHHRDREPDHRDQLLSDADRAASAMLICVCRTHTESLTRCRPHAEHLCDSVTIPAHYTVNTVRHCKLRCLDRLWVTGDVR